jgi:methyl-accepting chemotaxis protein
MLQLRRSEKDFLLRKDTKYRDKSEKIFSATHPLIESMEQRLTETTISTSELSAIKKGLREYEKQFNRLIEVYVEKGLHKNAGVYGKLRADTHALESELAANNDFESHVALLTLRRHEKDFILRSDEKYIDKLVLVAEQLATRLSNSKEKQLLSNYVNGFIQFAEITKRIGLDSKSGVRGEMRAAVHTVESNLEKEVSTLTNYISDYIEQSRLQQAVVTLIVSLLIIGAVIITAKQIITPLNVFSVRIAEIRKGNDLTQRATESDDEIGIISKEFNIFMSHFQTLIKSINGTVNSLSDTSAIVSQSVAKTSEGSSSFMCAGLEVFLL